MVRIFLYILFFFLFYYVFRLLLRTLFDPGAREKTDPEAEELVQDPCCLTYISKRTALRKKISGKEVHFCGQECLRNYLKDRQIRGA
jgi:YHS domain-containing protein